MCQLGPIMYHSEPRFLHPDALSCLQGLPLPNAAGSRNRLWLSLQAPATLAIILFLPQAKLRVTSGPLHWNYPLPDFLVNGSFFSFLSQFKCHLLRETLTDHSSHRPSSTTFPGLVCFSVLLTLRNDHICFLCSCFTYLVFVQYSL